MLTPTFHSLLETDLIWATHDTNQELQACRRAAHLMKIRITEPVFFQGLDRKIGEELDVQDGPWRKVPPATFPSAYGYDLVAQFEEIKEARRQSMSSVIDRIKAKALQARDIVPTAIKEFEADLDSIISGGPMLATKRAEAVGPHQEATKGLLKEIDGLKGAMDILSNGGDPLDTAEKQ
jgi:hypothetical protein